MQWAKLISGSAAVGTLVAAVFVVFEYVLHEAIHFIWYEVFHTESSILVPSVLAVVFSFMYFASVRFLDNDEQKRKRPLTLELPVILIIGFLSLFAGATLGPEAILIPAALLCGQLGAQWFRLHEHKKLFGMAGFVALFVAFFGSLFGGVLGYYLAKRSTGNTRLSSVDYISISLAAITAYFTLGIFSSEGAFRYPGTDSGITATALAVYGLVFIAGLVYLRILQLSMKVAKAVASKTQSSWWQHALIAGVGLGAIYLIGGQYVYFTGNEEIVPVFQAASTLGVVGLIWISIVKVAAISWSVAMGYRGGLVFPLVLVASSVVAIATLYTTEFNIVFAIFIFLFGILFADRKSKLVTGH